MSLKINKLIFFLLPLFLVVPLIAKAQIDPKFNPNNIISDSDMLNYSSMTLDQIQNFLKNNGSYLTNYQAPNTYGKIKTAAEIIYEASTNNYNCDGISISDTSNELEIKSKCQPIGTINPKVILTLLQKEMSLIEDQNPATSQLDWAVGYGCLDGQSCNSRWQGLGKQVNSAALQFYDYMINSGTGNRYKVGQTYLFTNPYGTLETASTRVTPENRATAALYDYTPHVYNGNYNFYKLWNKYFPVALYPDGSLLQTEGITGVWLIRDGKKYPFTSQAALSSRFDIKKVISVNSSVLNAYEQGEAIKFPNYSLVKIFFNEKMYLLVDDEKREIVSDEVFKKIGFNPEELISVSSLDIAFYKEGEPITLKSTYPMGALLQDRQTGGVYWVYGEEKSPLLDKIFLSTKFKGQQITAVDETELTKFITSDPVKFNDGELLKGTSSPAVYLIADGQKRPFTSGEIFVNRGYQWGNIITVSEKILDLYPQGEPVNLE
jgi:hypothetical protein